jgi:hypothetical protein
MNRKVTFELTDELVLRNLHRTNGIRSFLSLSLGFGILALIVLAFANAIGGEQVRDVVLLLLTGAALLAIGYYWFIFFYLKRASLAAVAKLPHRLQTFTITDTEFHFEDCVSQASFTWDMLERVECFRGDWQISFPSRFYLLPAEQVDENLVVFIQTKARQRGIQVLEGRFFEVTKPENELGTRATE